MVAAVADELGIVDEGTEAARIALIKLPTHQFIQPLPGGDSACGLSGEYEAVRALVGEVLVERVGLVAVELPDDPLVSLAVLLPCFLCGFQRNLRVLLDEHREVIGQSVELGHFLDVGAHEANTLVERCQVLPVNAGPDVVGQGKQILPHGFQVFEDRASSIVH